MISVTISDEVISRFIGIYSKTEYSSGTKVAFMDSVVIGISWELWDQNEDPLVLAIYI